MMKRGKKELLCMLCICTVCVLGGCGNREDQSSNPQSETITDREEETQNQSGKNANEDLLVPETGNERDRTDPEENMVEPGTVGSTEERNGENGERMENGAVNDVTDNGTGVGGAAKDIVDGVGDAGKDLIDGVEDAGDALVGEAPDTAG